MESLRYALVLLINFVFDTYIFILLSRLLLQKLGAQWTNPVIHFIVKLTQPVVVIFRRWLPGVRGFDLAIVAPIVLLEWVQMLLLLWIKIQVFPGVFGAGVVAFGMLGNKLVNLYFYAIIINVIMTWVPSLQHSPIAGLVSLVVSPPLNLARRFIPNIGGFDLSPIPVLILLKLIGILICNPIIMQGYLLAY